MARATSRSGLHFDFEVSLSGTFPLIWRRFLLRARGATFADLHRAIQDVCGWQDYHLYRFEEATPRGLVGIAQSPVEIEEAVDDSPAAHDVGLAMWVGEHSPRACRYVYDFGDEWVHDVVFRGYVEVERPAFRLLKGGERSFPPEDAGGMFGFERILTFVETGADPDGVLAEWLGDWKRELDVEALRTVFDADRKPRARG
jgi:hypothetical protein